MWLTLTEIGEAQGLDFILDICRPGRPRTMIHPVPRPRPKPPAAEDISYLEIKQVFTLPSDELCRELVRCYFHHIHTLQPIVDAQSFLECYDHGGPSRMSHLLLWSIFFIAAGVRVIPKLKYRC